MPPGEFIWSPAKHFLFRNCPRAWFFRYYLAQGGWNVLSADPAMHAYLLKYLSTVDSWMSSAAEESLTGALQEIMSFSGPGRSEVLTEAFQVRVSTHLIRARDDLVHREYLTDPKRVSFQELYYETGEYRSESELLFMIQNRFRDFFQAWEESDLAAELAAVDPLSWRLPPEHRIFPYAGYRISLRPWIYAVQRHRVTAWLFSFAYSRGEETPDFLNDPEEYGLPERVLAAWCVRKYPEFQVCVRKVLLTPEGLVNRSVFPVPVSEDFVMRSADEMLREANHPAGLKAENYARPENPEICSRCRFRELCGTLPFPAAEPEPCGESDRQDEN